jgi:hypothetical protein
MLNTLVRIASFPKISEGALLGFPENNPSGKSDKKEEMLGLGN